MTQAAWQNRLTAVVAGQIRRYRRVRGLSARQVSERCAELGLEIHRQTLADLETGRRASITLAELLVIAQVLAVSPTLLITPVDTEPRMEILPGREARTVDVLDWFAGESRFISTENGLEGDVSFWTQEGPVGYVHLYRHHETLITLLTADPRDGAPDRAVEVKEWAEELRLLRRALHEDGLRMPDLPPELSWIDLPELSREELNNRIRHAVRRG